MGSRLAAAGAVALVAVVAIAVVAPGGHSAGGASSATGDPARGAATFQAKQCWSCHAFAAAGSSGKKSGPSLDRWLLPHAAQLRVSPETLAAGRIAYGGRGMTAYGRELDAGELADLVAFVVGRPVTLESEIRAVPPAPAPPPETRASAATVARWRAAKALRGDAARGAALFAREGCLSCHRYLGAGKRRFGGADLSRGGPTPRSIGGYAAYVSSPAKAGNRLMPGYADLPRSDLRALGAFLAASRRARS